MHADNLPEFVKYGATATTWLHFGDILKLRIIIRKQYTTETEGEVPSSWVPDEDHLLIAAPVNLLQRARCRRQHRQPICDNKAGHAPS
jgi:hypothetical protein